MDGTFLEIDAEDTQAKVCVCVGEGDVGEGGEGVCVVRSGYQDRRFINVFFW